MVPSPTKSRTMHKSSGKPPRHKGKDRSNGSSSFGTETVISNGIPMTPIRKDEVLDIKDIPLALPEVMPLDQTQSLPRCSDLIRGIPRPLEEIDGLQLELELLLSSVFVRQLSLTHQIEVIDHLEKGRLPPKVPASPGKRAGSEIERPTKRLKDNSGKAKDVLSAINNPATPKPPKVKCSVVKNEPLFDVPDVVQPEVPKVVPAKNDMINRFWQMVNQYCQEITADDIKCLEDLSNVQNEDGDYYKIPPLGRHYSLRWAQEDLAEEQKEGFKLNEKRKIKQEPGTEGCDKSLREVDMNGHMEYRKLLFYLGYNPIQNELRRKLWQMWNLVHWCNDDVAPLGPLTQRVLSGLIEENISLSENIENKAQGIGIGRPGFIRNLGLGNTNSLEKRIKKELQDQGIFDMDGNNEDEDDEILGELKRCQSELKAISSHNQLQLNRLLKLSKEALVRHDLKKRLSDVDVKVVEMHRLIAASKQKKKPQSKKDKDAAWKLLKEREALIKQLDAVSQN